MSNCVICEKPKTEENDFVPLSFENQDELAQRPIHYNCFRVYLKMLKEARNNGIGDFVVHIYNDFTFEDESEEDIFITYLNKVN